MENRNCQRLTATHYAADLCHAAIVVRNDIEGALGNEESGYLLQRDFTTEFPS
jgi:hypothetical protein